MREFIDRGFLFGQGFGMTETSPTVFMLSEEDARRKVGSIGKPVLFCDYVLIDENKNKVEIGEVGELLIRGTKCNERVLESARCNKRSDSRWLVIYGRFS